MSKKYLTCRVCTLITITLLALILRGCSCPECPPCQQSEPTPQGLPPATQPEQTEPHKDTPAQKIDYDSTDDTDPNRPRDPNTTVDPLEELAETDHIALFKMVIENYQQNISDYTGTVAKHERVHGKLGEKQIIDFKFKEAPYSLFMTWKQNPGGADKLLYVEGKHGGKMIIHPTGILRWMRSARKDPAGKEALQANLNPCYKFGFLKTSKRILADYELAQQNNDLRTAFLGEMLVDGRPCILTERIFPEKKTYRYARLITAIDREYLVPVYLKATYWNGDLYAEYSFTNLKFNVGLTDKAFTPQANHL